MENNERRYEIRLKIVGEVQLLDADKHDTGTLQIEKVSQDIGKIASFTCGSDDLRRRRRGKAKCLANYREVLEYGLSEMAKLALEMDTGKFNDEAFADAIRSGEFSNACLNNMTPEIVAKLRAIGISTAAPLIPETQIN
jgi:hypothetical protein